MSEIKVKCKFDKMVHISEFKPHPCNPNKHTDQQIERLAKILIYQGIRSPVVISNQSGFCVKGHGTAKAILKNGWTQIPVVYQDFENDEVEYAYMTSDNAIADWAELDFSMVNAQIPDFDPQFDLDMLGIRDFTLDPSEQEAQGSFYISIRLASKDERDRLFDKLHSEGFQCRTRNRKQSAT